MRVIALFAAVALSIAPAIGAQTKTPDQVRTNGLVVGYRADEYFGEVYTARSRESVVFFQGERIAFRVQIRNIGTAETALVIQTQDPQNLFTIQGFQAPPPSPDKVNEERPSANGRYLDEVDVITPMQFSPPSKVWSGGSFALQLGPETVLDPGESIEWVVNLPTRLEPGLYRFVVRVNGSERGQRPLFGNAPQIRFEVRRDAMEAQPEILRRSASRSLTNGDYPGARRVVNEILKIQPNSSVAYEMLEVIAVAEGKTDEAASHRARAIEIIQNRRDELRTKFEKQTVR